MEWTRTIDGYCERTDFTYWSEPVNALTNLAFLLAAALLWRRSAGLPLARALVLVLAAIGVGSWLFHTHATVWGAVADVVPIAGFILLYVFAVHRHVWGWSAPASALAVAGFVPYAAATVPVFAALPGFSVSAAYWPVPLLIAIHAVLLWRREPALARGFAAGAAILVVSLAFRSVDEALCAQLPLGTHFMWHLLNAAMLGWMIEVYVRHRRATLARRPGLRPQPLATGPAGR